MGADVDDIEPGGRVTEGIRALLPSGSAGGVAFWGRDVSPDPPGWSGP